ncbi:MAG: GAF domain-containing sensor histidine kinase, partial [Acidobacteria bacterium]|nr:GAF domain-containing sensor histidine kinase [Acidobacteriota bacterium]
MSTTAEPATSLDDIVRTALLLERHSPPRDIGAEHEALIDLIGQAATAPSLLLQRLVDLAVELCDAGSAGVSLLEPGLQPGKGLFRWVAMAGEYRGYAGRVTPEGFSPCGACLTLGTAQLYLYPARLFTYLAEAAPPIVEGLVIPLRSEAGPLGTIWIVSHDESRRFTARDVALMTSLADFTSTALALQRARDEAEAANRAKDEFLAVVSHELRRPLTAIIGWSELLLAGRATPATAARAIEALYTNARRQRDMIEDLLDASRALTGALRLSEEAIDLAAIVRTAIEEVAGEAREREIELVSAIAIEDALPFFGDPERLHQVVGNLLGNAVKFTAPGGCIFIGIQVAPLWVEISVRDTGIGIASHLVPLMFDAFRKADASSTRRDSGLGLGLTIARRLVKLHDGTLEAQSDGEGRGALLTVRLPAERLLAEYRPSLGPAGRATRDRELSGITILVVDDE